MALRRRSEGAFFVEAACTQRTEFFNKLKNLAKIFQGDPFWCILIITEMLFSTILVRSSSQNANVDQRGVVPVLAFVGCGDWRTIDFSCDRQNTESRAYANFARTSSRAS